MKVLTDNFRNALIVKQAKEHLTYKELSKITGVNRVTLSNIINGKTETLQEKTFDKLNDWLLKEE
ncbi:helix-turn-helix domain-containing protein [Fructobacillus tropaeoli]|uniref:HTH cro/C1-type domain-containing protein n=1 Tax=Fructobacillus tropaeoli TaxID=709323 RepID=A0A3F3H1M0_9LACO|nr:helix-turn-helix domain-containing protein [Fructobacillus tropaeoli]GAP04921.1 hypothetical protein FTRO_0120290 [Fructobacillus tropaeoli]